MARENLKRLLFAPIITGTVLALILVNRLAFGIDLLPQDYAVAEVKTKPEYGTPIEIRLPKASAAEENLLNLNRAGQEELEALPGIGKVRAAGIVKQRESMGGFYTTADVMCTQGVGVDTYKKIKDMVTVSVRTVTDPKRR